MVCLEMLRFSHFYVRLKQVGSYCYLYSAVQQLKFSCSVNWQSVLVVGSHVTGTSHRIFRAAKTSLSETVKLWLLTQFKSYLIITDGTTKLSNTARAWQWRSTINGTAFKPVVLCIGRVFDQTIDLTYLTFQSWVQFKFVCSPKLKW